ncbi:MAG TPA: DUF4175 family protein [Dokdonella sp.]|nr:DUF4175 family protein [Dokdonella sp.]HQY54576.1 DUF4175 family protein [Dokdonella sp.]
MTMHAVLRQWQARLRRRAIVDLLRWLPLSLVATVFLASRFASAAVLAAAVAVACAILLLLLVRAWRMVDARMAVRRLDAQSGAVEDSADLLLASAGDLAPLQALQRERVLARLHAQALPEIARTPLPRFVWPLGGVLGVLVLASFFLSAADTNTQRTNAPQQPGTPVDTQTVIRAARLDIEAPAYTGLPPRSASALEAAAAEGSILRWRIHFEPDPGQAKLVFLDGREVALIRGKDGWQAEITLSQSSLYRIVVGAASTLAEDRQYRLDAIIDQIPEIKVIAPEKTLTQLDAGQRQWSLDFEVADDYGVADAQLAITLAQGSGEQVTVSEHSKRLRAEAGDDPRHRRYRHHLDLAASGFAEGDDLIVRLLVSDNRQPQANQARSASYILRWPADPGSDDAGIDGIVQKVLPAYFRSQRQIIIDTEALIVERPRLDDERFLARSDTIGVDQKILRLRYGQFLGEEFESGGQRTHAPDEDHGDAPTQQDALSGDHDHETVEQPAAGFGKEADILAEFGHTHDHAEAATLLDPETRKILKAALAEMWQAELHLRQGEPGKALPYENRALDLIKQVQQSTRIYLARVGLELPPVDESRRLSGERSGLRDRRGVLADSVVDRKIISNVYQQLADGNSSDLDALAAWLRAPSTTLPDTLGVLGAVDELQRRPDCGECRRRLLDQLWSLLPVPAAAARSRIAPDASGRRYLELLQQEAVP